MLSFLKSLLRMYKAWLSYYLYDNFCYVILLVMHATFAKCTSKRGGAWSKRQEQWLIEKRGLSRGMSVSKCDRGREGEGERGNWQSKGEE